MKQECTTVDRYQVELTRTWCRKPGGCYGHSHVLSPVTFDLPETVKTLQEAVAWLDAEREREKKLRHCSHCGSPGFSWKNLRHVFETSAVTTFEFKDVIEARETNNAALRST